MEAGPVRKPLGEKWRCRSCHDREVPLWDAFNEEGSDVCCVCLQTVDICRVCHWLTAVRGRDHTTVCAHWSRRTGSFPFIHRHMCLFPGSNPQRDSETVDGGARHASHRSHHADAMAAHLL